MTKKEIDPQEAKSLVDRLGPHMQRKRSRYDILPNYDSPEPEGRLNFTYEPVFPETRRDVCAMKRTTENGVDYGYDTVYLIWKAGENLDHELLVDTHLTKDNLSIDGILEDETDIIVKIRNSGSYSGHVGEEEYRRSKAGLGIE